MGAHKKSGEVITIGRTNSIQYDLLQAALPQQANNNTAKAYKRAVKRFAAWARQQGYKSVRMIRDAGSVAAIQAYEQALELQTQSPSTIHTHLAPICKGLGVPMDAITKPKRAAGAIKRGRNDQNNKQGKSEAVSVKYERLVALQRAVGIRRSELAHLTGSDLIKDSAGEWCVRVRRGKGGKEQLQRILPQHLETVRYIMAQVGPDQRVFVAAEMANCIDLHNMRSELAKEAYDYYAGRLESDPGYRQALRRDLMARWMEGHGRFDDRAGADRFATELSNPVPYRLRGANKAAAIAHGRPVEYDRLAMMAVSVYHLSHWRLDVTSVNYLT